MVSSAGPSVGQRGLEALAERESKVEVSDHRTSAKQGLGVSSGKTRMKQREDMGCPTGDKGHEPQGWQLNWLLTANQEGYELSQLGGRRETCVSATKVVMEQGDVGDGGLRELARCQEH